MRSAHSLSTALAILACWHSLITRVPMAHAQEASSRALPEPSADATQMAGPDALEAVAPLNPSEVSEPATPPKTPAPSFSPGGKSGASSQAISVPQGSAKVQGMGESFSAQLSTGIL